MTATYGPGLAGGLPEDDRNLATRRKVAEPVRIPSGREPLASLRDAGQPEHAFQRRWLASPVGRDALPSRRRDDVSYGRDQSGGWARRRKTRRMGRLANLHREFRASSPGVGGAAIPRL